MRVLPVASAALPAGGSARAWLAERSDGARLHAGIDLGRAGDGVLAPEAATVFAVVDASYADDTPRFSRPLGWAGYGPRVVVLEGDSGAFHVLAHVEAPMVEPLQRVHPGEHVAMVSRRGNHLHWEVRSSAKPPRGWATVEVSLAPDAWLEGRVQPWSRALYGCPPRPTDTTRTPRACRPAGGFVEPTPSAASRPRGALAPPWRRGRAPDPTRAPRPPGGAGPPRRGGSSS